MARSSDMMDLEEFLNSSYQAYHVRSFIETDPVQIPHRFKDKADIEISALLTATIAWGQRKSIINSADRMMAWMDHRPLQFITTADRQIWKRFDQFVHRTFQPADMMYFLDALRNIYGGGSSLEEIFTEGFRDHGIFGAIMNFRKEFLRYSPLPRTCKHISDPSKGSAAKRLNLMLMWMCRQDDLNIHFGLWRQIPTSELIIPLDLHVGRVARQLGLLTRKANDWRSAVELTEKLRQFDPVDPVRYDFSLFCTGLDHQ